MHVATDIFAGRVFDGLVIGKMFAGTEIQSAFVSVQAAFPVDVIAHDLANRCLIRDGDMERADVPTALD